MAGLGPLAPLRHVLALINDDDVPMGLFDVVAIFPVVLERVDGNNRFVVVVEWVLIDGYIGLYFANSV